MSIGLRQGEVVKPIPGLEGRYSVTSMGRVFSHVYRHRDMTAELAQARHPEGYMRVKLSAMNKESPTPVHRLVALAFHPNPGNLPQVNHIDGNKSNNDARNLEWVDNSGNQRHAFAMGLQFRHRGSAHHGAILSDEQVREIKRELASTPKVHGRQKRIAQRYGVTNYCIFDIERGKSWTHITCE